MVGIGGGFWTDDVQSGTDNTITGGTISGNTAYEGAGAYLNDGTTNISQETVSGNTASEAGGGFWIEVYPNPTLPSITRQSTISANTVTATAGGSPPGDGGGILAFGPATHSR